MSENNHTDSDEFSTLIDDTDEFYTQRVEELMEADGLTKAEARRAALYAMKDGSPLPYKVVEQLLPPEDWHVRDPANITSGECAICDDTVFMAEADEGCHFCGDGSYDGVNDWGEPTHVEPVEDPGTARWNIDPDDDRWFICGGCYEGMDYHGSTLVVVMPDGRRWKVTYDGSVVFDHGEYNRDYEWLEEGAVYDLVQGIVLGEKRVPVDGWRSYSDGPGSVEVEAWDEFTTIGGGWHSTMEKSEFSERINDLTGGEALPPFPMAVRFGTTSNVFSMMVDVYAPADCIEDTAAFMGHKKHSGLAGGISYKAD